MRKKGNEVGNISKIAGDFIKVEIDFCEKNYQKTFDHLDEIFTSNNWNSGSKYYTTWSNDINQFLYFLGNHDISIYEKRYISYKAPDESDITFKYYELKHFSKARRSESFDLYWNAVWFFGERGYALTRRENTSNYMNLVKREEIHNDITDIGFSDNSFSDILVRCGQIEANRILLESMHGYKYIFVFPYPDEQNIDFINGYRKCFLIEIGDSVKRRQEKETQEAIQRLNKFFSEKIDK